MFCTRILHPRKEYTCLCMPVDTEHFLAANDALVGDNVVPPRFDDWRVLEGLGVQAAPHRMEISLPRTAAQAKANQLVTF